MLPVFEIKPQNREGTSKLKIRLNEMCTSQGFKDFLIYPNPTFHQGKCFGEMANNGQ